jgi:hypothetical protein
LLTISQLSQICPKVGLMFVWALFSTCPLARRILKSQQFTSNYPSFHEWPWYVTHSINFYSASLIHCIFLWSKHSMLKKFGRYIKFTLNNSLMFKNIRLFFFLNKHLMSKKLCWPRSSRTRTDLGLQAILPFIFCLKLGVQQNIVSYLQRIFWYIVKSKAMWVQALAFRAINFMCIFKINIWKKKAIKNMYISRT